MVTILDAIIGDCQVDCRCLVVLCIESHTCYDKVPVRFRDGHAGFEDIFADIAYSLSFVVGF